MKQTIRLTESTLRKIVKESVKKVLNEIQYGGESLHGNDPSDWYAMRDIRNGLADAYGEEDEFHPKFYDNLRKAERNSDNASSIYDREGGDIYSQEYMNRVRKDDLNGRRKAARIANKLGLPK